MTAESASWLAVLPAVIAVGTALLFQRVVASLLLSVVIGIALVRITAVDTPWPALTGRYLYDAIWVGSHFWILAFTLTMGGLLRIVGGLDVAGGVTERLTRFVHNRRRAQLVTLASGILLFFDDYTNTLVVGAGMRPIADRVRMAREKLAFVVDATSATVASLAPLSTWIAVELVYIADQLQAKNLETGPYQLFLATIPTRFYPWLMLGFVGLVAVSGRDFGPMRAAENAAGRGSVGQVAIDAAAQIPPPVAAAPRGSRRLGFGLAAVAALGLPAALAVSLIARPDLTGLVETALGGANLAKAIWIVTLAASAVAIAVALRTGRRSLREPLAAWLGGANSMVPVLAILVLAWVLAAICSDLHTAQYLARALGSEFDPRLLPAIVFLLASATSFATGTSWGTMAILFPIAVPLAVQLAPEDHALLALAVSSILSGAVFGDHCSPISDTTILSAMASGCDHMAHVRTQLPYAVLVGSVSVVTGSLPVAFGLYGGPTALAIGLAALAVCLRTLGRPTPGRSTP